jgi:hypothetical protein
MIKDDRSTAAMSPDKSEIPNPKSQIERPLALRPPQFGLKTLLLLVTAAACLLALRQWISPIAIISLVLLAASVFCHIAGNAIGTRLRQIGDRSDNLPDPEAPRRVAPRPEDFAPVTRLSERRSLGWAILIATSIGLTSGAIGGGLWTFVAGHGNAGALNIAVGVIAFGVLGGLASFAVVAFFQVLAGAIWQALTVSSAGSQKTADV